MPVLQLIFLLVFMGLGALIAWQGLSGVFTREVYLQDKLLITVRFTGNKAVAVGAGLTILGLSLVFVALAMLTVSPPSPLPLALGFIVGFGGFLLCSIISF